jgi:serine/threonine protein kinase
LAEVLDGLHQRQVVHGALTPEAVLVQPATRAVFVSRFGAGADGRAATEEAEAPPRMTDALAYISPEQTGRMNRSVDYRTDLYSAGVIFYEMLTGGCPFVSEDPMAVIHGHLARRPEAPHERTPAVPEAVSSIVLKLLAKVPEDRYHSAYGLQADLQACREAWQAEGRISGFVPGRLDQSGRLQFSDRIYGR